jgi:hypothetical protein
MGRLATGSKVRHTVPRSGTLLDLRQLGPLGTGALTQHLGYAAAFGVCAGIAALGDLLFLSFMPETRTASKEG